MSNNKLIIAAAGSGKTTLLVREALKIKNEKVLITTFTQANETEIRKKIIEEAACIPENITVQTWFSFLLQHGVRPFQGCLFEKRINGLILISGKSGIKCYRKPCDNCKQLKIVNPTCSKCKEPVFYREEKEFEQHYFSNQTKIYSDKLSKFVCRSDTKTNGCVVDRLSRVYPNIFVDEVQDLAGYDLEFLKLLFNSSSNILLVGDPRQGTYSTNNAAKNKQFQKTQIINFFDDNIDALEKDDTSLLINYRCIEPICTLSNSLFNNMQQTISGNTSSTDHDGIYLVKEQDVELYLKSYCPMQLRYDIRTKVNGNYPSNNFGDSKGLTFDRVLIYTTKPILNWLINSDSELKNTSRSKLYVAITRARYSVAFVVDNKTIDKIDSITKWSIPVQ